MTLTYEFDVDRIKLNHHNRYIRQILVNAILFYTYLLSKHKHTHTHARTHAHTHTADRLLYTAANRPEKIFLNLAKRHFLVK